MVELLSESKCPGSRACASVGYVCKRTVSELALVISPEWCHRQDLKLMPPSWIYSFNTLCWTPSMHQIMCSQSLLWGEEFVTDTPPNGFTGVGKKSPSLKESDWQVDTHSRFIIQEVGIKGRGILVPGRRKSFHSKGGYPAWSVLEDGRDGGRRCQEPTPAMCWGDPGLCQGTGYQKATVRPQLEVHRQKWRDEVVLSPRNVLPRCVLWSLTGRMGNVCE